MPKSNDRMAARTFFLWFVEVDASLEAVTSHLCKSLLNLKCQRQSVLSKHQVLIEKLERTDVQMNRDELLSQGEKLELEQMNKALNLLKAAEMRLHENLMVARDF